MQYAKLYTILSILAIGGLTVLYIYSQKDTSIDSLRIQAQKAQQREIEARIDREIGEDNLSKALYDSCYTQATTGTGSRFVEQQRKAHECWKQESTISWTVAPAISGVPPKWITPITASPVTSESTKKVQSHTKPVPSVKKIVPVQSSATSSKYWTAYEIAISQIHKWEGLRLTAYWDHNWYSIGYGSRAKSPTEKITKAEADRRLAGLVTQILGKVQKDFPKLRPEAQGALVSFAYNCHSGYRSILRNGLSYHGQWCKTASGQRLSGLVNRRAEESKLIFFK